MKVKLKNKAKTDKSNLFSLNKLKKSSMPKYCFPESTIYI